MYVNVSLKCLLVKRSFISLSDFMVLDELHFLSYLNFSQESNSLDPRTMFSWLVVFGFMEFALYALCLHCDFGVL